MMDKLLGPLREDLASQRLLKGAAGAFAVNVAGMGVGFLLQIVLARLLGLHEYGLFLYLSTWVTVLSLLCIRGFDAGALRYIPQYLARSQLRALAGFMRFARRRTLSASIALGVVLLLAVTVSAATGGLDDVAAYVMAVLLLPVTVHLQLNAYFLLGLRRTTTAQALQLIARPALLAGGAAAIYYASVAAPKAGEVLLVAVLATGLVAMTEAWAVRRAAHLDHVADPEEDADSGWAQTAWSLLLITLGQQILTSGDLLIVGMFLSPSDAGVYGAAAKLATLVGFATMSINLVLAPAISDLYHRGERELLQRAVIVMTRVALGYAILAAAVLILAGERLLDLFGAGFDRGYWILVVLAMGQLVMAVNGAVGFLMTMTGHHDAALVVVGFAAAAMVGLSFFLLPSWGTLGVAAAASLALALRSALLGRFVWRQLHISALPLDPRTLRTTRGR